METAVDSPSSNAPELNLLKSLEFATVQPRRAALGSLLVHAVGIAAIVLIPLGAPEPERSPETVKKITPLIAPLTQPEPNKSPIRHEIRAEELIPRPKIQIPKSQPSTTRAAAKLPGLPPPPPQAAPRQVPVLPDAPKVESAPQGIQPTPVVQQPALPLPTPPPPQIQTQEKKPGSPFESINHAQSGPATGAPRLNPGSSSVSDAIHAVARQGTGGGQIVGDVGSGIGGIGNGIDLTPAPGRTASTMELKSDPMGVDFRPYLTRILTAVKRNWQAVLPESYRLGRRGKVTLDILISRDGSVPKLVLSGKSGLESYDRAAVAGVSASNPFPPLPTEFKGDQIRVELNFLYNMK